MKNLKRTSTFLCERLRKFKKRIQKYRNIHELIAENLVSIFLYSLLVVFFISILSILLFSRSNSSTEVILITRYAFFVLLPFYVVYNIFAYAYVNRFIILQLANFSSRVQYDVLLLGKATRKITVLIIFITIIMLTISTVSYITGSGTFLENLLITKTLYAFLLIFFGLATFSLSILSYPSPAEEMKISFRIVREFEILIANQKASRIQRQPVSIWKNLMKMIVSGVKRDTKQFIGASIRKLVEPFNITTLALVTGNNERREKARKWVEELGKIILNDTLDDQTKAERVLEHMKIVEQDFPEHVEFCRKYEINYGLEGTDLMPQLERILRIFGPIATVLAFLVVLIRIVFRI